MFFFVWCNAICIYTNTGQVRYNFKMYNVIFQNLQEKTYVILHVRTNLFSDIIMQ